jgi:TPR repeat protein
MNHTSIRQTASIAAALITIFTFSAAAQLVGPSSTARQSPPRSTPAVNPIVVPPADTSPKAVVAELERRRTIGLVARPYLKSLVGAHLSAWQSAADRGDAEALYLLGECHAFGLVPGGRDGRKATELLFAAAEAGCPMAMFDMAMLMRDDAKSPRNADQPRQLLARSAAAGCKPARSQLLWISVRDALMSGDAAGGEKMLRTTASRDDADPAVMLRLHHVLMATAASDADGRAREAIAWLRRAAERGHVEAQFLLGEKMYYGLLVPRDVKGGIEMVRRAADAGSPDAIFRMAEIRIRGIAEGGEEGLPNRPEGERWFEMAVETGDPHALAVAAEWLAQGILIKRDPDRAYKLASQAADQGDATGDVMLSQFCREGVGVKANVSESFRHARRAAEAGDPQGMNFLACHYRYGWGVPHNEQEAIKWFDRGAALGEPNCLNSIGLRLANGRGMKRDHEKAFAYFYRAALANNAAGIQNVADALMTGRGVKQDNAAALEWFRSG